MPESPPTAPASENPRPAFKRPPAAPGALRRSMSTTRRWARDTFSREQLASGLKQLAWVAPLTLLIWVYAEREQQDDESFTISVAVRSSNPQFHARLVDPLDGLVQVTVAGPRSRLEQVGGQVGPRDPVIVNPAADGKTGLQSIPLATILDQDARFQGLSVQNSTPTHVGVDVDPIDEVALDVQLRDEDRAQVQEAVFTPRTVKVRMPRKVLQAAREANAGQLVAHADLGKLAPGKSTKSNVRVVIAGADPEPVRIDPTTVSAAFDVRAADEEYVVASVPVTMDITQGLANENEIKYTPASVFNVRVRGPREAIEKLKAPGGTRITASIPISREDIGEATDKAITLMLPPDVRIHEDSGHEKSVRLTVTKRGPSAE